MAKALNNTSTKKEAVKIKRKGVHAKTKTSTSKFSKHYVKMNVGQGH